MRNIDQENSVVTINLPCRIATSWYHPYPYRLCARRSAVSRKYIFTSPNIDISAPDFDLIKYCKLVQEIIGEDGIPLAPYAITWEGLTCKVPREPPQLAMATVLSSITAVFSDIANVCASLIPNHHVKNEKALPAMSWSKSRVILKLASCLVLGSSVSGTLLLFSGIASREMPSLAHTSAHILYQSQERLADIAKPAHTLLFIPQKDAHILQLTVCNTFEFAAACKWPTWIPFGDVQRHHVVILTARILGIERTLDIIVGSNVLRSVSGGERKRVTIGEMAMGLVGGTLIMDNWSEGLNSATTLSINSSMRDCADYLQGSAIVSMQAPHAEVYKLFNNFCLLSERKVVYFGPWAFITPPILKFQTLSLPF